MPDDASQVSSEGSWEAARPFVGNPGPTFDPEQAEQAPRATPLQVLDVIWEAPRVRSIVRAQGLLTHQAIGVGQEDWLWRAAELDAISEPLAETLNKFPVTRAAAAVSDELTVGAVMIEYVARSIKERSRVIRAHKERQRPRGPVPVTGVDAAGERIQPSGAPVSPDDIDWEVPD